MFAWGAITIGIAGVNSYATVAVTRFLLGLFEAGESIATIMPLMLTPKAYFLPSFTILVSQS